MKNRLAIALVLCFVAGCGSGNSSIPDDRSISDKIKRIRSDIENLKSEYETAITDIAKNRESMSQKELELKKKMQQLDKLLASISVPGPIPVPGPVPPQPDPQPPKPEPVVPQPVGPVFPNSKFNLSADIYKWAIEKVPSAKRLEEARLFADAATDMAEAIKPGDPSRKSEVSGLTRYDLAVKIQDLLGKRNKEIPPEIITTWKALELALNARINTLYSAGKLVTNDDWALLFREIAAGLREVRS